GQMTIDCKLKPMKCIIIPLLFSILTNAQSKTTDSLLLVKTYLTELKKTATSKQSKKAKLLKLEPLLRDGIRQRGILNRNIKRTKNPNETEELVRLFNFILQSAILYKSDIKNNYSGAAEISYLKMNIPVFLQKME